MEGKMWPLRRTGGSILMLVLHALACLVRPGRSNSYPTSPLPLRPIPSASQLAFQEREMAMLLHFGINTFTDSDWGTGTEDPSLFDPVGLDTNQWVRVAKAAGFKLMILTVKHHEGFCLWQTQFSNFSVASSPWKGGDGDVLLDFITSAFKADMKVGIYLSPWDRHDESYGDTLLYNEHYVAQLREILTKYGPISEVWLDGAKGPDAVDMTYYFDTWFDVIKQLQPGANIFSDSGPDLRWVGNEFGSAGATCWAMLNRSQVTNGKSGDVVDYLNAGDPNGTDWVPAECDVSIRPGWFWHPGEDPWPLESLIEMYFNTVGRNSVLLLNVPPNSIGVIDEKDTERLLEFRVAIDTIFADNRALGATVTASSTRGQLAMDAENSPFAPSNVLDECLKTYWIPEGGKVMSYLDLELKSVTIFNVLRVQETVALGQRVSQYSLLVWVHQKWQVVLEGTTIGFKRLTRLPLVEAQRVRLQINSARAAPAISSIGLYLDEVSVAQPRVLSAHDIKRHYFRELDEIRYQYKEQALENGPVLRTVADGSAQIS